jgi:hypothetical protein
MASDTSAKKVERAQRRVAFATSMLERSARQAKIAQRLRRCGPATAALLALIGVRWLIGRSSVDHQPQPDHSARRLAAQSFDRSTFWPPSGGFVVPDPGIYATKQDLVQYAEPPSRAAVVQASAIELETNPSRLGSCDFTDDSPGPMPAPNDEAEPAIASDVAIEGAPPIYHYPATSLPDDDAESRPQPSAMSAMPAPGSQRPLPGPVNLVVGRDRNVPRATATSVGARSTDNGPRENLWSRWTQGWRQKFEQAFSSREPAQAEEAGGADFAPPETDEERYIPAAAGEAWYNRRWR